ncbi:rRNA adenine N-6-methyltransferase family protein [Coprobacillaceae bacterium CR2/5/TPMF4]|nr:rRNA adenine N-6-methyltransferase family protein [Coprobacillaceae bacterium CR2/5/TPMF4]
MGALTQRLALQSGKVISFEIDERFKPVYRDYLNFDNLNIIFGDFMEQDIAKVVLDLRQEFDQVYLIANLPYYITTPIIEKVLLSNCKIDKIVVMIQKEVALKMTGSLKIL